jgi:hypothetical protein
VLSDFSKNNKIIVYFLKNINLFYYKKNMKCPAKNVVYMLVTYLELICCKEMMSTTISNKAIGIKIISSF